MPQSETSTHTTPHYRPFTLAREGELRAFHSLASTSHARLTPVFIIPARTWDYDKEDFAKTMEAHLAPFPQKLTKARKGAEAFVDTSLLDDERPVHGTAHPLIWLAQTADALGLALTPVLTPESSPGLVAAAQALHQQNGRGVALKVADGQWPRTNASPSETLLATVGISPSKVDLFLDFGSNESSFVTSAIQAELQAPSVTAWRSVTVGGYAWPSSPPGDKGVSVLARHDWKQYVACHRALVGTGVRRADFFDHLVNNPKAILEIDPRFLSISAAFRYATEEDWLFSRGELYKASQGRGMGGKAVPTATGPLTQHHLYGSPIRTLADDWIDDTVSSSTPDKPGNASTWRQWATYRHVEVTLHSLASSFGPSTAPGQGPSLPQH